MTSLHLKSFSGLKTQLNNLAIYKTIVFMKKQNIYSGSLRWMYAPVNSYTGK